MEKINREKTKQISHAMFALCTISSVADIIEMCILGSEKDDYYYINGDQYYDYNHWRHTMSFGLGLWCVTFNWISAALVNCAARKQQPRCFFIAEITISQFAIMCTLIGFIWSVINMSIWNIELHRYYGSGRARAVLFFESIVAISNFALCILSIISSANACSHVCSCCAGCCGGCSDCCADDVIAVNNTVFPTQVAPMNQTPVYSQQPIPMNTTGNYYPVQGTIPVQAAYPVQGAVTIQGAYPVQGAVAVQGTYPMAGTVPVQGAVPYRTGQVAQPTQPVKPVQEYVMPAIPETTNPSSGPKGDQQASTTPLYVEPPPYTEEKTE